MIKSQSTWNQPIHSRNVLDLDIITLYFDCTLAITPNVLATHGVSTTKFWFFEKMKKFHHLTRPFVSKHINVWVLQHHSNLR
jgi:hypothetical protein